MSQIDWAPGDGPDDIRPLEGFAPPLEQAFAAGKPQRVGWYRFYFADKRWERSPEVEQIHGYQPGTVTPTTQLMLSHKHPDDYEYVPATLADMAEQLLADVRTLRRDDESASYRSTFDRLLLTTHQRVRDTAARKHS